MFHHPSSKEQGRGEQVSSGASTPPAGPEPPPRRQRPSQRKPDPKPIDWEKVADEELLKTRICDLPITIDEFLKDRIQTVYRDLDAKGIVFHPECYLGDEWFTTEGEQAISIPYYLAHPRLVKLEKTQLLEAEGESRDWFLRLLRHETGHAVSHAYDLHRAKGYRKIFGPSAKPYLDAYRPQIYSRRYVRHLEDWYAQSHPDEDFAETFAVWLTPTADWRTEYAGWGALKKLEFVDRLMEKLRGVPPKRCRNSRFRRLSTIRMTIGQNHKIRRKAMAEDSPEFFDRDLTSIFAPRGIGIERAARFLRRHRKMLVETVSHWTGEKRYTIHYLVTRFAERSVELRLTVHRPEAETLAWVAACLTSMANSYFLTGKFKDPS